MKIDLDKEEFHIFKSINEIFRHIKQSTKNSVSKKSTRLLALEFEQDDIIQSKTIKFIIKKVLPDYK